jgi:superfamily II DNA or RNA helicase
VKKYHIKDAVDDGRLAKPVLKPIEVRFNPEEQEKYDQLTANIKEISRKLQAYDPIRMTRILGRGGPRATLAKAWFASVRERKNLLSSTELKLRKAVEVVKSHPGERIMIFSETIDSIELLRTILEQEGIRARSIHNGIKPRERHEILASWGEDYFPLLSVHTLEIGYDVPQAGIAIIIASTSNMNQVAQRIGRVVRISEGKNHALVYVIYVAGSKDTNVLKVMSAAIEKRDLTAPSAGVKADKPAAKPRPVRGQKTLTKFS